MRKPAIVLLVLLAVSSVFAAGISVDTAGTMPAGKLRVSVGGDLGFFNRFYNNDGNYIEFSGSVARTSISIPLSVKYGFCQNTDLSIDVPFVINSFTTAANTKLNGSGFGDLVVGVKSAVVKDSSMAVSAGLSAGLSLGKSALNAASTELPTASGFFTLGLNLSATTKLFEGNELSVNAGYKMPFATTVTSVYGVALPELKVSPAGTITYGILDKSNLSKEMTLLLEVSGYTKADGSATFSAGGDAAAAVIVAGSPEILINKQSAVFVKPALQFDLSDKLSVTAGASVALSLVNDYSALPANVFASVTAGF